MKFICEICQKEISEISIFYSDWAFRNDFHIVETGLKLIDKEYFRGNVVDLMYECDCGTVSIKYKDYPQIDDFIKFGHKSYGKLSQRKYGPLIIKDNS